jgi:mevalonate kinase
MKRGSASACGKAILFGEHFVVHGGPALALPVTSVRTEVQVTPAEQNDVSTEAPDEAQKTARLLLHRAVELLDLPSAWHATVTSSIPMGHGLGSSAAFAVALVRALMRAADQDPDGPDGREAVNAQAHALEQLVHGTPSGIDDTVISFQRPLWLCKGRERERELLRFPRGLHLLLASSGSPGSTMLAVSSVRRFKEADPARFEGLLGQAQEIARQGRAAFEAADARRLGRLLDRNHDLLCALGVSTHRLDRLVAAARRAGAHGAKLTGAGLGGFVLVAVDEQSEQEVNQALRRSGAAQVLTLRGQGASQTCQS